MDPSTYTHSMSQKRSQINRIPHRSRHPIAIKKRLIRYQIKLARDPVLLQCALHDRPRLLQVLLCTQTSSISPIPLQLTQNAPHSERIRITFRRNRRREDEIRMERSPRYWGKRVEKELTSSMPLSFQDGSNFSIFQWSMLGSSSHGLGLSCFPFRRQVFPSGASAPSSAATAAAFASSSNSMAELKRG
jgi:hypothetical protein